MRYGEKKTLIFDSWLTESKNDTLDMQVGGDHYKKLKIQPIEFIEANNMGFAQGNVVKYVSRYRYKNGVEDLKKARHYLDMLIEAMEDEE